MEETSHVIKYIHLFNDDGFDMLEAFSIDEWKLPIKLF